MPLYHLTHHTFSEYGLLFFPGIHETTEYLEVFLRNLLLNEKNPLHNRMMHINKEFINLLNESLKTEEANIEMKKVNIKREKANIVTEKVNIDVHHAIMKRIFFIQQ